MAGATDYADPFEHRRSGKDRRRFLDPRYRNPQYPSFCDRRKQHRRRPEYEKHDRLIQEHPNKRWITVIGVAMAFFLLYVSLLTNMGLRTRLINDKKNDMGNHLELPYISHHTF
jgi:hypothetical protein